MHGNRGLDMNSTHINSKYLDKILDILTIIFMILDIWIELPTTKFLSSPSQNLIQKQRGKHFNWYFYFFGILVIITTVMPIFSQSTKNVNNKESRTKDLANRLCQDTKNSNDSATWHLSTPPLQVWPDREGNCKIMGNIKNMKLTWTTRITDRNPDILSTITIKQVLLALIVQHRQGEGPGRAFLPHRPRERPKNRFMNLWSKISKCLRGCYTGASMPVGPGMAISKRREKTKKMGKWLEVWKMCQILWTWIIGAWVSEGIMSTIQWVSRAAEIAHKAAGWIRWKHRINWKSCKWKNISLKSISSALATNTVQANRKLWHKKTCKIW